MVAVCHWLICCFDVYLLYIFFHSIFERRLKKPHFTVTCFLAMLAIVYVNSFNSSKLNLVGIPLIYLGFVLLTFKISIYNAVTYTIIFYVVFVAGKEAAFVLLNRFLYIVFPEQYMALEGPDGLYILIVDYLLGYLMLLLAIKHTDMLKITEEKHFSKYLLVIPASSLFILCSFMYMDFPESRVIQLLICIGSFLLYFSNLIMFIMLSKYAHIVERIKCTQMYTLKAELEMQSFRKVEDLNEKNRRFIHDSHAFNSNIRMLALRNENDKIIELIDQLEGKIHKAAVEKFYSSNSILDAILSERVIKCEAQDVKINIFVEPTLDIDFIQVSDLISMFGNLLDNAIEVAAKCNKGQREIDVKLSMANQYILVLHIENSFITQPRKERGLYLTTKEDKRSHGLGIGIVKSLVEKYGGDLELTEERGHFITTLTLSNIFSTSN